MGKKKLRIAAPYIILKSRKRLFYIPLLVALEDAKMVKDEAVGVRMARAEEGLYDRDSSVYSNRVCRGES